MRARVTSGTALAGSAALLAGLLGTVVPAAPAAALPAEVAGIETAGPIATVGAGAGPVWPTVPTGAAVMPRGGVVSPDSPFLYVPALRSASEVPVRVVEVSRGLVAWSGALTSGWTRVGARLGYAQEYRVQVQQASGSWSTVGSFSVAPRGAGAGASVDAGGLAVSVVTGQVTTSWASPRLAGPSGGAGVGLTWGSGAAGALPGLPGGWALSAAPGPWALLSESATDVAAARVPGAARAVRAPGSTTATVTVRYPAASGRWVRAWVAQRKIGSGPWRPIPLRDLRRGATAVTGAVGVPAQGAVWLRVGARVEETTLWGPASAVTPPGLLTGPAPASLSLPGSGARSLVTPGDQPPVVRLTGWDGSQLTFVRNGLGVYEQAGGAVAGYANRLTWVGTNAWELADSDGGVTSFANGRATSYSSKGAHLASFTWDGSGRLTSLTNEIGRVLDLRYAGTDACASDGASWTDAGFAAPPAGMLCQIAYPDGTATDVGYVGVGVGAQIGLVKDPGNTGTTYGWDESGRLAASRAALVSRAATVDSSAASAVTRLTYGADGRVARIADAPAVVDGAATTRRIDYPVITESDLRDAAAAPGPGTAVSVVVHLDAGDAYGDLATRYRIDPVTWRSQSRTDARGLTASTGTVRSTTGTLASSTDPTGRVTSYSYSELGEVTAVNGPTEPGSAGAQARTTYDTARTSAGIDDPLSGLRALVYSRPLFAGTVSPQFLKADFARGALSASWSGRPAEFSAQAAGVWNPASSVADAAGRANGWQFRVSASGGTDAELVVGGNVCAEGTVCIVSGLPTGPKAVSVQLRRAGSAGWVQVLAAPVGAPLAPLPADDVRPGYGLTSVAATNDELPGGPAAGSETRYAYANPATGSPTGVTSPGGLTTAMTNEASSAGSGSWGRPLTTTTPGGKVASTAYWGDDVDAALPAVCGGDTVRQSGQVRTVTRTTGSTLGSWYDLSGRLRAQTSAGGGATETTCTEYSTDGATRQVRTFDTSGALLESSTTDPAVGGDPLVSSTTVTHGPAAPVSPGASVTSTQRTDLLGRVVESTDASGAVTTVAYDALGSVLSRTVTPPAGSGASPLNFAYTYRPLDGLLDTVTVNGVLAATVWYDGATGRVSRVAYPNSAMASFAYLPNGALGTVAARTGDAALGTVSEARTQSAFGRVESSRVRTTGTGGYSESRGYTYDTAGRLARAVISTANGTAPASTSLGYSYGAQNASCPSGYAGAGKDNLRTGGSVNGAPYAVCHDSSGRLTSSASPLLTGGGDAAAATYDGLGRLLTLGGVRPIALTWGAGGLPAVVNEADGDGGHRITTTLDAFGGALRDKTTASDAGTATIRYAGPFRVVADGGTVTGLESVQYGLPGGATVTQDTGSQAVLTIPGPDGSALVRVPVPALGTGTAVDASIADRFGPYGEPLADIPTDTAGSTPAYTWRAAARSETLAGTSSISLLPARAYAPLLGEFLSQDPVLDAGSNAYGYTDGDPVNTSDPTGGETEDATTTTLLSAASAAGGLLALVGGFTYGRFVGKWTKGITVGKSVLGYQTIASGAAVLVGAGAAGYGAYAAAKSQQTDEGASIGIAVGASLLSTVGAYGMARWGFAKRLKEMGAGRTGPGRYGYVAARESGRPRSSSSTTIVDDVSDRSSIRTYRDGGLDYLEGNHGNPRPLSSSHSERAGSVLGMNQGLE